MMKPVQHSYDSTNTYQKFRAHSNQVNLYDFYFNELNEGLDLRKCQRLRDAFFKLNERVVNNDYFVKQHNLLKDLPLLRETRDEQNTPLQRKDYRGRRFKASPLKASPLKALKKKLLFLPSTNQNFTFKKNVKNIKAIGSKMQINIKDEEDLKKMQKTNFAFRCPSRQNVAGNTSALGYSLYIRSPFHATKITSNQKSTSFTNQSLYFSTDQTPQHVEAKYNSFTQQIELGRFAVNNDKIDDDDTDDFDYYVRSQKKGPLNYFQNVFIGHT